MHLPLVPLSFLATRHPPCILPSSSSGTSLYSLTSSSYASSSSYPTTFFLSCNTAFHPLQLSSLLPNPLLPLWSAITIVLLVFFLFCIHPVQRINLFIFLLFLLLLCNLIGFFSLFTLCILLYNILLVLPLPFTLLHLILNFCILHVFFFFFLFPPLPPYSLRLHSSSPSSFIFFLLSPLHSLFSNFPFSSPSKSTPPSPSILSFHSCYPFFILFPPYSLLFPSSFGP